MGILEGKNIVITGSGRGIGKAVAIACAREGAHIGLCSRTLEQLEATKTEIEKLGIGVKVVLKTADITKYGEVEEAFKFFYQELGILNGVIANAGASWRGFAHEIEPEKFNMVVKANIMGVFNSFKAAYPYIKKDDKKDKGRFLITGSAVYPAVMGQFPGYTASKYGVVGLQRELAIEGKQVNITVNMILPTQVDTKMLRGRRAGDGNKPPGVLDPEDLNEYYLFLMSDDANRIHDQLIYPSAFEAMKKVIRECPGDKKENWDNFSKYLEENSPKVFENIKKQSTLGEFIFNRLK